MKHWVELTDEYTKTIRDNAYRKIRLRDGQEFRCIWIEREQCFYNYSIDIGFYMDEPDDRPTHILIG